jgi:class 3 adenylate cyclase/tetratricopeptide (TPR) repeat protein
MSSPAGVETMTAARTTENRRRAGAAASGAQRRYLTIVFSDVCESTRIASGMDAEDYADLLGALRSIYETAVERHGGEIVRIDGDGVAILFGHPRSHEDDGRRATEAALDVHEAARTLAVDGPGAHGGLRLHTGIHSGLVLVNEGDEVRGRFEMLGDATNVAKRLADLAAPGEIIVSETTLGAERHFFRTGPRRLVTPRGKDTALAVFSILGRDSTETRFAARARRGLAPFVGRGPDLARMEAWLGDSLTGATRLGVVVGEAGLGKTRLVNAFLAGARAREVQSHRGYCEAYLGARPLQPFLLLLRSVFRIDPAAPDGRACEEFTRAVETLDPALPNRLGPLLRVLSSEEPVEARSESAVADLALLLRDLFAAVAKAGPLILFIDDWHWADDISRHALDQIRQITGRKILLLLATREFGAVEARLNGAGLIRLAAFSPADAEAAIGAMLHAPEPFLVDRIAASSGGNPLFIEELCHAIGQGDASGPAGGPREGALGALIESRFSRLPRNQADLVKAASVIGHRIPAWLFEDLTGVASDDPAVQDLEALDFIYPGETAGMLRFKHGLTRDAIYDKIGRSERRALHLRVVLALRRGVAAEADAPCEALAYHYGAGGDAARAAHYAERAGDMAMAVSSLDRAQAQYREALTSLGALGSSPDIVDRGAAILRKYGLACMLDPARDQLPVFLKASEAAIARGDLGALAWSEFWLGCICYGLGQARTSIGHCRRALEAARGLGDDRLVSQIRATLGQAQFAACEHEPALTLLDEAIATKRQNGVGRRAAIGLAYSLSCKGFTLADLGRFDEAQALFDEAIDALRGETHGMAASVLTQRCAASLWRGRLSEAAALAAEAETIAERVKARYLYSMSRALAAQARWKVEGSDQALGVMIEATDWLETSNSRQFLSLNYGWLTEAFVEVGEIKKARDYAARALWRARQGDRLGEAMALRALARAAAAGHGDRSAWIYLVRAKAAADARGSAHETARNRMCAAEIALAGGDRPLARHLLSQVRPALAAMGMEGAPPPATPQARNRGPRAGRAPKPRFVNLRVHMA